MIERNHAERGLLARKAEYLLTLPDISNLRDRLEMVAMNSVSTPETTFDAVELYYEQREREANLNDIPWKEIT